MADDNPINRDVIGKILERGGMGAVLVNDGEQALDALEQERFDAVLLDRNMPGIGGLEALRAIRVMARGRERVPVIMLSADVTPDAKREAFEAGADAFLPKPVEALRLLEEVHTAVSAQHAERRPEPALPLPAKRASAPAEAAVVNRETLGSLEELSSSAGFLEKLAGVFIADNTVLLARMEEAVAARNVGEFRSHLHAMKGSSASMGTDRLTRLCTALGKHSDAELRLQGVAVVRSIGEELAAASEELNGYLRERKKSAS